MSNIDPQVDINAELSADPEPDAQPDSESDLYAELTHAEIEKIKAINFPARIFKNILSIRSNDQIKEIIKKIPFNDLTIYSSKNNIFNDTVFNICDEKYNNTKNDNDIIHNIMSQPKYKNKNLGFYIMYLNELFIYMVKVSNNYYKFTKYDILQYEEYNSYIFKDK